MLALGVLGDDTGSDFDLHANDKDAGEDGPAGDATLKVINLCARLIDIERADDDKPGC